MKRNALFVIVGLLALGLLLVACDATESEPCPTAEPCPTCAPCPEADECPPCPEAEACPPCPEAEECPACPECPEGAGVECPYTEEWSGSGHADAEAEAFVHWDEDDPAEVPTSCAACHSTPGYLDYLGVDGSEAGVVDAAAPIGTVVTCIACHNEGTANLEMVTFPSGVEVSVGDDSSGRCMVCHQGRAWGGSVDGAIEEVGLTEDVDTPSEELGFVNIHYYAAAATLYGTITKGGYEYPDMTYDSHLSHVAEYDTCVECHSPHTLALRTDECAACHTETDYKEVRMAGSLVDYDGDGDMEEGIYYELEGLQDKLLQAIQAYAGEVVGTPIVYDVAAYPYFFIDSDASGDVSGEEASYANSYNQWTPRLLKAAYNFQTSKKDAGAYAHGGKYMIQLVYDSIMDLNEALSTPIDMEGAHRNDHGHFAGSEEAFRHWDEDGAVSASCATCHSAEGLPFFIEHGVQIEQPISNGLACETCHTSLENLELYAIEEVVFPSGATVSSDDPNANLCLTCHQGRSSSGTVDAAVEGLEPDAPAELRFINIHYFAAGATLFGNEVQGAYQYPDKAYAGQFAHVDPYNTCTECHNIHQLTVKADECSACHNTEDLHAIRISSTDYDGDGDTEEGIAGEIETMAEALYAAIQDYAAGTDGVDPIEYNAARYPYFFNDAGDSYATWTPNLLKAAYNYQYAQKDPGAFAHNPAYVIQVLYDSIEATGGDVTGMTRPEAGE